MAQHMHKYLHKNVKVLAHNANCISKNFDENAIHQFRVEIKKFRATLRLLTFNSPKAVIKLPTDTKKLYAIAGSLRDLHIVMQQCTHRNIQLPHFERYLLKQQLLHQKKWQKQSHKLALDYLNTWLKHIIIDNCNETLLLSFLKQQLLIISQLVKNNPDEEAIHTMRKKLKDMLYNCKLLQENNLLSQVMKNILPIQTMDELSAAMGQFNDEQIFIAKLDQFQKSKLSIEEKLQLQHILLQEEKALKQNRLMLLKKIRLFINQYTKALA